MIPQYKSSAMIVVSKNKPSSAYSSNTQGPLLDSNAISLFTKVAKSKAIASMIINVLNLDMKVDDMQKLIYIDTDSLTGVIDISVKTDQASLSLEIIKTYIKTLQSESKNLFLDVNIYTIDAPKLATKSSSPIIPVNVGLSALGGLLTGMLLIILFTTKGQTKIDLFTLHPLQKLFVLGFIPKTKDYRNSPFFSFDNKADESVRVVGANLQFLMERDGIKKVIISSPNQSEGKTTLSINLAAAMVKINKKVLVIDCNINNPFYFKIGKIDGQNLNHNYYHYVHEYHEAGFDIIMAPNDKTNIVFNHMSQFFESFENRYDLILVDCPYVMANADTLMLTNIVKNVVLVTDYRYLAFRVLEKCIQQLIQLNASILGIVINQMPPNRF